MQHDEVEVPGHGEHVGERKPVRRRVDEPAAVDQCRGLGEPGRVPERANLATCLVAGTGATVESLERRRLEEQRAHHGLCSPSGISVPSADTR